MSCPVRGTMHHRPLAILTDVSPGSWLCWSRWGLYEPCPLGQQGWVPYPGTSPLSPHSPHRRSLSALFIGPSTSFSSARFSRRPTCPDASVAGSLPTPPVPRHRKSHSLGNKWVMHWAPRALEGLSVGPGLTGWPTGALPPHRGALTGVLAIPARCPLLRLAQGQEEVGGACTAHTRYWWGCRRW